MRIKRFSFPFLWGVIACLLFSNFLYSQTTIYSEGFNNGCASNCLATSYGGWTVADNVGGSTGGAPNNWFVSCAEEGIVPPGCGSSCIGDASLHIGANPGAGGDMGASFNETGAANATFRRAQSPTISTVGFSTLTLEFDFIAFGSSACSDDRAQLWLSTDNGATWPAGFQYCLNSPCCGACNGYSQGQWTLYTLALPAAFNNNPNVRVGFHWRNNGNGSGTDPSVAIDDIRISTPIILPAAITSLSARAQEPDVRLSWRVETEQNLARYEVERAGESGNFSKVGTVNATGGSQYQYSDQGAAAGDWFYRLKMVDRNGTESFSNTVRITRNADEALVLSAFSATTPQRPLGLELWALEAMAAQLEVFDLQGRSILTPPSLQLQPGKNALRFNVSDLAAGTYLISIRSLSTPKGYTPVNISRKFVLTK